MNKREWPARHYEAIAEQRCVKCGMWLTSASSGHGTLGRGMCDGEGMGRVRKRLHVEDHKGSCRFRRATAEEKKKYAHLLQRVTKDNPFASEDEPWHAIELYDSWKRVSLSKGFLLRLLRQITIGALITPDVAKELLSHYDAAPGQINALALALVDDMDTGS